MKTRCLVLKSVGANGYLAKTKIFEVSESNTEMIVLQRFVLADIHDTEYFNNYQEVKRFRNKKLLKQEMVFYKENFSLLIGSFFRATEAAKN